MIETILLGVGGLYAVVITASLAVAAMVLLELSREFFR
ncbi:MAG: hypothetical protein JWO24_2954 [Rhodospirillales bacterium]|nr:hypothetical protein [Rhodospirillales bacterium]